MHILLPVILLFALRHPVNGHYGFRASTKELIPINQSSTSFRNVLRSSARYPVSAASRSEVLVHSGNRFHDRYVLAAVGQPRPDHARKSPPTGQPGHDCPPDTQTSRRLWALPRSHKSPERRLICEA